MPSGPYVGKNGAVCKGLNPQLPLRVLLLREPGNHLAIPWLAWNQLSRKNHSSKPFPCSPISPPVAPTPHAKMVTVSYHFERIDSSVSIQAYRGTEVSDGRPSSRASGAVCSLSDACHSRCGTKPSCLFADPALSGWELLVGGSDSPARAEDEPGSRDQKLER